MSGSVGGHNIQIGSAAGDVVILLDRPAYRLEFLVPPKARARVVPRSQRRQPSYLLDPQREVVPYQPRPVAEAALGAWLDEPSEDVSVLWVSGPGGQGKSRLAGRMASDRCAAGWAVAQAVERGPKLRAGSVREPLADGQALLVVVDYAERWPLDVLALLVENLPFDFPARRVRVLLLARPGSGVWDTVAAVLDRAGVVDLAEPVVLGDFAADRAAAFTDAAAAFTREVAPGRPLPEPPADLAASVYGSALDLHMAALAGVCAADADEAAPSHHDLSAYLLKHERRAWTAAAGGDLAVAAVIETTACLATLFGPTAGHGAAVALLRQAAVADGDADAARLLADHERLYPPVRSEVVGSAATGVVEVATLQPVRPDRFGEDFVGTYLHDRPHGVELLTKLVTDDAEMAPGGALGLRRCLIVLAAAAARHAAARGTLWSILGSRPSLTQEGGAPVLRAVVDYAPDDMADAVHRALPSYSTDLLRPAADLARRLTDALPADAAPEQRANRLDALGIRLSNLGRREDALTATTDAVDIYRRLAATNPAAFEPDLARGLRTFARVRAAGDAELDVALLAAEESVAIYVRLHEPRPHAFDDDLRAALHTLADVLDGLVRVDEAEEVRRRIDGLGG